MGELLDVVHEAEELPLRVDLHSPAQREAIESLVVSQIPEDWLYGPEALAVARSTLWGVEAPLHPIGVARSCIAGSAMEEGHLAHHGLLRRAQALRAERTRQAVALRTAEVIGHVSLGHEGLARAIE